MPPKTGTALQPHRTHLSEGPSNEVHCTIQISRRISLGWPRQEEVNQRI